MKKFWYARLENPKKYAVGSGDCEIAVVTGPDEITANDWAKQITAALNQHERHLKNLKVPPINESPNWKGPRVITNKTPGGF